MSKILYWLEVVSVISAASSQLLPSPTPSGSPIPLPPYSPPEENNLRNFGIGVGVVAGVIVMGICACKYFCSESFADWRREVAESQARDAEVAHRNPVTEWGTRTEVVEVEITGASTHPGEVNTWQFNSVHGNH